MALTGVRVARTAIATTAPTVNDDAASGWAAGDRWVRTGSDGTWTVRDVTAGAAVWVEEDGTGGGGGGTTDHALLSDLLWTSSAHTGTANRIAAFNGSGAASYLQVGSDVQAYDGGLAALAAFASTGILVATGVDTWTARSIGVSGSGLAVTNGSGVGGNPTITITPGTVVAAGLPGTTKGDSIWYDGAAYGRLGIGADATVTSSGKGPQVLVPDSTVATLGIKWADGYTRDCYVATGSYFTHNLPSRSLCSRVRITCHGPGQDGQAGGVSAAGTAAGGHAGTAGAYTVAEWSRRRLPDTLYIRPGDRTAYLSASAEATIVEVVNTGFTGSGLPDMSTLLTYARSGDGGTASPASLVQFSLGLRLANWFYSLPGAAGTAGGSAAAGVTTIGYPSATANGLALPATGGGGKSSGAQFAGGAVTNAGMGLFGASPQAGGLAGGGNGTSGLQGTFTATGSTDVSELDWAQGGTGGGGNLTGAGGNGGNGAYGCGGGGGGAGTTAGGAGGTGGVGWCIVETWP